MASYRRRKQLKDNAEPEQQTNTQEELENVEPQQPTNTQEELEEAQRDDEGSETEEGEEEEGDVDDKQRDDEGNETGEGEEEEGDVDDKQRNNEGDETEEDDENEEGDETEEDNGDEEGGDDQGNTVEDVSSPPLLTSFQDHVARHIWQGSERGVLRCQSHIVKLLAWEFDSEDDPTRDSRLFRSMFRRSKLCHIKRGAYKTPNKNLITAFVERWHPETNSFHLPFGEMTITLDDVYCITGLPVDGLPVQSTREERVSGHTDVMNLLGRTEKEASDATGGRRGSSVKLTWLKDIFMPMMKSDDQQQILYAA